MTASAAHGRPRQLCIMILISMGCCFVLLSQVVMPPTSWSPPVEQIATIIVVTPTYLRPTQIADMTRLCNTLMHIPKLFWVVVEDAHHTTKLVGELLEFCNVPFVHLARKTPKDKSGPWQGRGVTNRNEALRWIRENVQTIISDNQSAVIYFADDDNSYDIRLFDEIRRTHSNGVSMFPVGGIAGTGISTPVVDQNNTLLGYFDPYPDKRKYIVDMAGFAVGLQLFLRSQAKFIHKTGALEDSFLRDLHFSNKDIQFLADNCTKILVWHTKTSGGPFMRIEKLDAALRPHVNHSNVRTLAKLYTGESR